MIIIIIRITVVVVAGVIIIKFIRYKKRIEEACPHK